MQNCIKVRMMDLGGMNDKQLIKWITPKLLVIVEICVSFKKEKTTTLTIPDFQQTTFRIKLIKNKLAIYR